MLIVSLAPDIGVRLVDVHPVKRIVPVEASLQPPGANRHNYICEIPLALSHPHHHSGVAV